MNFVDILLLFLILMCLWSGYQKGFIVGALDLLLLALGLLTAFLAYPYVAAFFEKNVTSIGVWTLPLSFLLTYLVARILFSILASKALRSVPARAQVNPANRALGLLPGAVNGLLYAAIASALLLSLPLFDGLSAKARESAIANELSPHVEWAEAKLAPVFDKAMNHTMNNLTVDPESKKTVTLSFSVKNPKTREDLEAQMLQMVNEERQKEGLPALKADPEMREVARAHSRDMFARSYFSHINPEGKTPAERARNAGVRFLTAGENLALAPTLKLAHNGLMNSPGHRANILHKSFGRVGIGILEGGRHGLMVTQNFRN
jgi:uncharacterized protein YkwD